MKWKRKNPRKKSQKRAKRAFEIFFEGFSFSTLLATPSSFFQVWPCLSSMALPLHLYFSSLASLSSMILPFPLYRSCLSCLSSMVLPFPLYFSSLSSLSFMVLPFPLYYSSLSSMISSPCRPALASGTSSGMILKRFHRFPPPSTPSQVLKWSQHVCSGSRGSGVMKAADI